MGAAAKGAGATAKVAIRAGGAEAGGAEAGGTDVADVPLASTTRKTLERIMVLLNEHLKVYYTSNDNDGYPRTTHRLFHKTLQLLVHAWPSRSAVKECVFELFKVLVDHLQRNRNFPFLNVHIEYTQPYYHDIPPNASLIGMLLQKALEMKYLRCSKIIRI